MKKSIFIHERGFTMIEMMIVLLIITVLLLIAVPNMVKNNHVAQSKGCEATIQLLEAQVGAYEVEKLEKPSSLEQLQEEGYVDRIVCPDNTPLMLENGRVKKSSE
ncbi:competence type IV pilus major pilin ComGC [Aliibacillus thermotolerans]|uniref:ComG operon protein 3 n=1 Tax=Aliibacillus thermotolerans TaxID=1834418 RepID=A0ABW0U8S8_9BACI|nr:competence type IV pilus major pilin ComGC [Aliibacillus thermotolerans]MDA3131103.1 prepilin-type N-terminal cleavage/methylation domain-containing protein [Aliibacillus thermotolerans]